MPLQEVVEDQCCTFLASGGSVHQAQVALQTTAKQRSAGGACLASEWPPTTLASVPGLSSGGAEIQSLSSAQVELFQLC